MFKLMVQIREWLNSSKRKLEEGQGLVEYAIIIVLIAIVVIVALGPLGDQIAAVFTNITATLGAELP